MQMPRKKLKFGDQRALLFLLKLLNLLFFSSAETQSCLSFALQYVRFEIVIND
jgi:hypothetical protein